MKTQVSVGYKPKFWGWENGGVFGFWATRVSNPTSVENVTLFTFCCSACEEIGPTLMLLNSTAVCCQ